ncbi:MAG TPA: metallophosphoesterase [Thermoplasmata archaeon]|nr:metallophosphoesterase [Thermoplasmata archaeon]
MNPVLSPPQLLRLSTSEVDELLDRLEQRVPVRPAVVEVPDGTADEAIVFGDTHGDWRSTEEVVHKYRAGNRCLVGLGDYVDRSPDDCGPGSVGNALYLLSLAAEAPERVYLIQGNHETVRRIPALPHNLPVEIDELWGPDSTRYDRLLGLLERGPLAVTTPNGAYLAHAGFPRGKLPTAWKEAFASKDPERLAEITWSECDVSRIRRGAALPWGGRELDQFLAVAGLRVFLRGHDPDLNGRVVYGGRCLTLNTSRIYERYGGVTVACLPLRTPLVSLASVVVDHLSTEGKSYSDPD